MVPGFVFLEVHCVSSFLTLCEVGIGHFVSLRKWAALLPCFLLVRVRGPRDSVRDRTFADFCKA